MYPDAWRQVVRSWPSRRECSRRGAYSLRHGVHGPAQPRQPVIESLPEFARLSYALRPGTGHQSRPPVASEVGLALLPPGQVRFAFQHAAASAAFVHVQSTSLIRRTGLPPVGAGAASRVALALLHCPADPCCRPPTGGSGGGLGGGADGRRRASRHALCAPKKSPTGAATATATRRTYRQTIGSSSGSLDDCHKAARTTHEVMIATPKAAQQPIASVHHRNRRIVRPSS
jgi:hypothetical protein